MKEKPELRNKNRKSRIHWIYSELRRQRNHRHRCGWFLFFCEKRDDVEPVENQLVQRFFKRINVEMANENEWIWLTSPCIGWLVTIETERYLVCQWVVKFFEFFQVDFPQHMNSFRSLVDELYVSLVYDVTLGYPWYAVQLYPIASFLWTKLPEIINETNKRERERRKIPN